MSFLSRLVTSLTVAATLASAGCSASQNSDSLQVNAEGAEPLQVVTTFLPMTSFTQAVAGDRAQVTQLLPSGVDPHDYQAKPQDAQRLSDADVLVKNGLSFEQFLTGLIDNAGNSDLIVVDSSEGVEVIASYESEEDHEDHSEHEHSDEEHSDEKHSEHKHSDEDHSDEDHSDEDHSDEDHSEKDHAGHQHSGEDPHIWLDPKKAVQQVENIRDALIAADPDGSEIYTANAADYITKLQALDQETSDALAPYADKTFVTYHDFAAHFAQSYNLNMEYLVDVPESSAAPADVRRVIDAAQASNLKTLLSEPQQTGSPFESAAKDLGIEVSTFDPLETSDRDVDAASYYLEVMADNVDHLKAAFGNP